ARPMPEAPPVTRATLPASFAISAVLSPGLASRRKCGRGARRPRPWRRGRPCQACHPPVRGGRNQCPAGVGAPYRAPLAGPLRTGADIYSLAMDRDTAVFELIE